MYRDKRVLLIGGGGTLGTFVGKELLSLGARVDVLCPEEKTSDDEMLTFIRGLGTREFLSELFAKRRYDGIINFIHYRYAEEYKDTLGYKRIITTGGGSNAPEYIIHQAETVVKHLGVGAHSVRCEKKGDELVFSVSYPDDRYATMIYGSAYGFTTYLSGGEGSPRFLSVNSDMFGGLINDMLRFFDDGTTSFSSYETLEVMSIREGAIKAMESPDSTVVIDQ